MTSHKKINNKNHIKNHKSHSLRNRFILVFCAFTLVISMIFGSFNFLTIYSVEDSFIGQNLQDEAQYLLKHYQSHKQWPKSRSERYKLYHSAGDLPEVIRIELAKNPKRSEFYGKDGKHYHLYRFALHEKIILVAEVSDRLVVRKMKRFIIIVLSLLTFIITVLACFIAYRLAKRTLSPLTRLSEMFANAHPSELPKNFAKQFPDNEIGLLANALDCASQRTDEFVERELQFTQDASHELRTPIAIVSGAMELLKKSSDLSTKDLEIVRRIDDANLNMAQTVQTLLALAREEEKLGEIEPINVLPVVEKIIVRAAYLIDNKNIKVNIEVPTSYTMRVQRNVLDIVLWNLISNAFQYTDKGSVSVYVENNKLLISDTGIGIERDIRHKICEPSIKGSHSQGFGIGLSIVKRLCEKQKLTLEINNLTEGTQILIH